MDRKKRRTLFYETFVKGWKLKECSACGGSGYYDNHGCSCYLCNGTGKERVPPNKEKGI